MQCLTPQHELVRAIQAENPTIDFGPNPNHRCDLKQCKFKQLKRYRNVYFCGSSLQVHICSNHGCPLAVEHHDRSDTGFYYCPISGIEMRERSHVAQEVVKTGERYHRAFGKVGKSGRRASRSKSVSAAPLDSAVSISPVTVHRTVQAISRVFRRQPHDIAKRLVKNNVRHAGKFLEAIFMQCGLSVFPPPPPAPLCEAIASYCSRILPILVAQSNANGKRPAEITLIAVVISLLKTGLVCKGVTIFPQDAWAAKHCPTLVTYAQVDGIQCRAMSNCTRLLKKFIFNAATSAINPEFVFVPLPSGETNA